LRARLAKWALLPYQLGLGFLLARQVLVLTTTGRITGKMRQTPLWYVRQRDVIYCFSGWGSSSQWWRNLIANPRVLLQIGRERWETQGVVLPDLQERERVLGMFMEKYGRRTVHLFYHLDRLCLVAFRL
jgi:deazaflavin-dependent oxidoreductase (nitroreductase family)